MKIKRSLFLAVFLTAVFFCSCPGLAADDTAGALICHGLAAEDTAGALISQKIPQLIEPYTNENGHIDPDAKKLEASSHAVLQWAQELEKNGSIEGYAYCAEGYSVSFFLNDGTTTVYAPEIENFMSGGNDLHIAVLETFPKLTERVNKGAFWNPAWEISSRIDGTTSERFDRDTTIEDLKSFLGSLGKKKTRAVFWIGHGILHTTKSGNTMVSFSLPEEATEEKKRQYAAEMEHTENKDPLIITGSSGNFAITYRFIEKYMSQVDGGLFFSGTCYGACDGGTMAAAILEKGFDTYVGDVSKVNVAYSYAMMKDTAKYLAQKDEKGQYYTILEAVRRADRENTNLGFYIFNDLAGGGGFVVVGDGSFRLTDYNHQLKMFLTLTSKDGSVDLNRVSLKCIKTDKDGEQTLYDRFPAGDHRILRLAIPEINKGDSLYLDISYDGYILKRPVIENIDPDISTHETIDLSKCFLDIILQDTEGRFVTDARLNVSGADPGSGPGALIQSPALAKNSSAEPVYRIPLEPGTYNISILPKGYDAIRDTIDLKQDTTVVYTIGQKSAGPETISHEGQTEAASRRSASQAFKEWLQENVPPKDIIQTVDLFSSAGDDGYMQHPGWDGTDLTGFLAADIRDYDQDGQDEMLLISFDTTPGEYSRTNMVLKMQMYEYDQAGDDVCSGAYREMNLAMTFLGDPLYRLEQVNLFTYDEGDRQVIAVDLWESMNDTMTILQLFEYDGKNISFTGALSYEQYGEGDYILRRAVKEPFLTGDDTIWTSLYNEETWHTEYEWYAEDHGYECISKEELQQFRDLHRSLARRCGLTAAEEIRSGFMAVTDLYGDREPKMDVTAVDVYKASNYTMMPVASIVQYSNIETGDGTYVLHRKDYQGSLDTFRH